MGPEKCPYLVQHWKGGLYIVIDEDALDATNSSPSQGIRMVVYKQVAGERFLVRRHSEFWGEVAVFGRPVSRFMQIHHPNEIRYTT